MGCGASKTDKVKSNKTAATADTEEPIADAKSAPQGPLRPVGGYVLDISAKSGGASSGETPQAAELPIEDRPTVTLDEGITYTGQWKGNKKHGKGKQVYPDGATFEGDWLNGLAHGYGVFKHADGTTYEGEWANGKANGKGVLNQPHGYVKRYEGEWRDDLRHGFGKEERKDGTKYEGNFENGKMHGRGKVQWVEGTSYEGELMHDELNGWGRYTWDDRKYNGEWQDNLMHGAGEFTWNDGRSYKGVYNQGKKEGWGMFKWSDGREYSGWWKNNKHHGYGIFKSAKGESKHAEYDNGNRVRFLEECDVEQFKQDNNIPEDPELPTFPDWLLQLGGEKIIPGVPEQKPAEIPSPVDAAAAAAPIPDEDSKAGEGGSDVSPVKGEQQQEGDNPTTQPQENSEATEVA